VVYKQCSLQEIYKIELCLPHLSPSIIVNPLVWSQTQTKFTHTVFESAVHEPGAQLSNISLTAVWKK